MGDAPAQAADQLQVARRRALGPYVARLRDWNSAHEVVADREMPVRVEIGEQHLILDSWAGEQLRIHFERPGGAGSDCPGLLVQVVALLAKSADDVQRLTEVQGSATEVFYAQQAELMLDVTLGAAVLAETRRVLDGMQILERADEAQHLDKIFHRLRHALDMVSATLERSERKRSESSGPAATPTAANPPRPQLSPERSRRPPADEIVLDAGQYFEAEADAVAATSRESLAKARAEDNASDRPRGARSGSRTRFLLLTLALVLLARGAFVELPRLAARAPQPLTAELLGHEELLQRVTFLPPSLYVDIDERAWRAAGKHERGRVVDEVAQAAEANGCDGVLLRTTTGRPLAQWWATRGVVLYSVGSESVARDAAESPPSR